MKRVLCLILSVMILLQFTSINCALAEENIIEDYAELCDPMKMSDEELFGVWNKNTGEWSVSPRLRYDAFPDLSKVVAAVKSNNYSGAKAQLKDYYKNRTQIPMYPVNKTEALNLSAQLYAQKLIGNLSPVICFEMTDEEKWYEIDLTSEGEVLPSYQFFDADKKGGYAEIASKESSNAPYIEIVLNDGEKIKLDCTADTYLRAGQYKANNYGTQQKILVSEKEVPHGDETRRAYMNFNISEVPESASVSSIKLYVYGKTKNQSEMQIVIYNAPLLSDMKESTVCWNDTTHGVFNYKGSIFDWSQPEGVEFEWINSLARLKKEITLTEYFQAGGEELYAYRALENILNLYKYQVIDYPRPLDTSWRTPTLLTTLFGLMESKYMTDEVFCALIKNIAQTGDSLKDAKKGVINQHLAMKTAFLRLVLYLPEIYPEDYTAVAKNNLLEAYNTKVMNEDGSYKEATSGYIGGVLEEMEEVISILKNVEGSVDSQIFEIYRKLALYYADLSMPDSRLIPYGDGGRSNIREYFQRAADITGDRNLIFFANNFKKGVAPEEMSKVYPYKKLGILRSNWTRKAIQLFTNAETGGQHGHPDDLHIDLYAYSYPLLTDPGNGGGYNDKLPASYVRTETLPHNTVEINGKSQSVTASGKNTMKLRGNDAFDFLEATTYANDGFEHTRKISLIKNSHIIVTDYITPDDLTAVNTYKQAWHPDNGGAVTVDTSSLTAKTHFDGTANLTILQAEKSGVSAVIDKSYIKNKKVVNILEDYVYYQKTASGKVVYNTVLYPTEGEAPTKATLQNLALNDSALPTVASAFKLEADSYSGIYYISHEDEPKARTFGNYSFDGEMLYLTENLSDVSFLNSDGVKQNDGTVIVESRRRLADFSFTVTDKTLNVSSTENIDGQLKIYAPSAEVVLLNGKKTDFTKVGEYVYINPEKIYLTPVNGAVTVTNKIVYRFPVKSEGVVRSGAIEIDEGTVITANSEWDGTIEINCEERQSRLYVQIGKGLDFTPGCKVKMPFYKGEEVIFNSTKKTVASMENNLCVFNVEEGGIYELPVKWAGIEKNTEIKPVEDTYIVNSSSGKNTVYSKDNVIKITLPKSTATSGYRMGFMRFNYGNAVGENMDDIQKAEKVYLKLTTQSAPTTAGRLVAYGLEDDYWYSDTLWKAKTDWQADSLCAANMPSALKVYAENPSATPIGPETVKYTELLLDVTDYAKSRTDGVFAFKLYAQTDNGAALSTAVYSGEGEFAPTLIIENDVSKNEINTDNSLFFKPDDDSYIRRNSSGKENNYAVQAKLYVNSNDFRNANSRYSFLRFNRSEFFEPELAEKIYLKLYINESNVKDGGSGRVTLYGLEDNFEYEGAFYNCKTGWAESDITGNSAAELKLFLYNNYKMQRSVSGTEAYKTELCFDVTEYVKNQADGIYAFMLHAEADDASKPVYMSFFSEESGENDYFPSLWAVGVDTAQTSIIEDNQKYVASGVSKLENISENTALVILCTDENGVVTDISVSKEYEAHNNTVIFAYKNDIPYRTSSIKAMLIDLKSMKPFAGSREKRCDGKAQF